MTTEEKAKAYDDAIKKAEALYKAAEPMSGCNVLLETIFPELKESDDERIKKELINYFINGKEYLSLCSFSKEDILAWLEKQDDKKSIIEMKSAEESLGIDSKTYNKIVDECIYGENKPADKVKPKFKVGDWVVISTSDGEKVVQIDSVEYFKSGEPRYITSEGRWFGNGTKAHLWTIQDAKDGDVLSFNDGHGNDSIELIKSVTGKKIEFLFCLTNGNRYEVFDGVVPYTNFASRKDATPATKEQRDLLFQKMKEAGYEWDAEKKELKKIEQQHSWSEEDECYMAECINAIATKDGWSFEEKRKTKHWLKSIKDRYAWKPSDEQLEALDDFIYSKYPNTEKHGKAVKSLYQDLKKLKANKS